MILEHPSHKTRLSELFGLDQSLPNLIFFELFDNRHSIVSFETRQARPTRLIAWLHFL